MTLRVRTAGTAVGLTLLVVASVALVGLGPTALADSHATEIGCTTIDEPGVYHLASDLSGHDGTCLTVRASDVTIDGRGHTISGVDGNAVSARSVAAENVTVRNLVIDGASGDGVVFANGVGGTIENVRASGTRIGILVGPGAGHVAIRDAVVEGNGDGITIGDSDATIRDTIARDNDRSGIRAHDFTRPVVENVTVVDNGQYGLWVTLGGGLDVTGAEIRGHEVGVYVDADDPAAVTVRQSVIAGNDVGIDYAQGGGTADARTVFWGASDGPSSVGDEPVADPETGALANGSGDAIAGGGGDDGTAIARFDPWLESAPATEPPETTTTTAPTTETATETTTPTEVTTTETTVEATETTTATPTVAPTTVETTETPTPTTVATTVETTTTATPTETTPPTPTATETATTTEPTAGTPRTDTVTETVGSQPTTAPPGTTAGTATETDEATGTATRTNATDTLVEGTESLVGDTTTEGIGAPPNVPGVPGFGALGAFAALVAAGLLALRRD